ncbi:integral membrane sensor signal transduction histidine kinase [Ruminiclostridium papyrosolvens DSM 2782]|uniref:Integral membrane sensor signal transduction histidine kinase n=1 Tax=Ruminiclostridium papyrosolvens DSM 2782 TaxID=588581 RepID=F1T7M1_9FIRM|nr:sensor histidine kinase [Ruminiclostridium papyrosolvens]EGD49469.1 integral membrane sensor signal transduction histidine kinase [Ruminiclostridium papyrosolvens DSM 2782]WES33406.1 histidine kinase [Ruminiclostridium papyrosolvens DSM 2782]
MKNWLLQSVKKTIRNLTFRSKITYFIVITICITVLIIVAFSYTITSRSIKEQAKNMTMQQLEQNTLNLEDYLKNIESTPDNIINDKSLQEYLSNADKDNLEFTEKVDDVYKLMSNILGSKRNILYVYVYKLLNGKELYLGPTKAGNKSDFSTGIGYLSKPDVTGSPMRTSFRKDPVINKEYTLSVYRPIFDIYRIRQPIGILGISVSEDVVARFYSHSNTNLPLETFIMDGNGMIISHMNKNRIYADAGLKNIVHKQDGSKEINGKLVVYKYVKDWDWYVVGTLPISYLLRDNNVMLLAIFIIVILSFIVGIFISYGFSKHLFKPFDELIYRMSRVSAGDMETRISLPTYGPDFQQVSQGFNIMVEHIDELMKKIYEEQRQLKEIEFKALQSQINPHFLYNTLESIHWQALLCGHHEISTMVKALAGFYRISLSKGEAIISLKNEAEHVDNYMTIQEIRYKEKMESYIDIPEEFYDINIPKMTLQPLVENAIYHGLRGREAKGFIKITAERDGNDIIVKTIDNGTGMTAEQISRLNQTLEDNDPSVGYGVRNVHQRIKLFLGSPYGLYYESNEYGGVTVNVRLRSEI